MWCLLFFVLVVVLAVAAHYLYGLSGGREVKPPNRQSKKRVKWLDANMVRTFDKDTCIGESEHTSFCKVI